MTQLAATYNCKMSRLCQSSTSTQSQRRHVCTAHPLAAPSSTRRPPRPRPVPAHHCHTPFNSAPFSQITAIRPHKHRRAQLLPIAATSKATQPIPGRTPIALLSGVSTDVKNSFLHSLLSSQNPGHSIAVLMTSPIQPLLNSLGAHSSSPTPSLTPALTPSPTLSALVTLPNGSVLGSAADESHLRQVRSLAGQGVLQYIVLEDGPCESPLMTAASFELQYAGLGTLGQQQVELKTLITVLDASRLVKDLLSSQSLSEAGLLECQENEGEEGEEGEGEEGEGGVEDDRTLADVLVEQVEYAHVLLLHNLGGMEPDAVTQVHTLLRHLNRQAQIHLHDAGTTHQLLASHVQSNTGTLDLDELQEQGPGWAAEINAWGSSTDEGKDADTPPAAQGVSTWLYGASRPFHPQRLLDIALVGTWPGVVRSKGYVWLATRNDFVGLWQSAGGSWQCEPSGRWLGSVPESERPTDTETSGWHPLYQDRSTQLVWTGVNMQEKELRSMLDACLVTDEELSGGPELWDTFVDPLPEWEHEHDHDHEEHEHGHVCDHTCKHEH